MSSNVLVYYNRQQDGGDPKHLQRYQQALVHLQQLVASSQEPQLSRAVTDLRARSGARTC